MSWSDQVRSTLRLLLADARAGELESNWRTLRADTLVAARRAAIADLDQPVPQPDPRFPTLATLASLRSPDPVGDAEIELLLHREVSTMPAFGWWWEPVRAAVVGPVHAIESWYRMSTEVLAADRARDAADKPGRDVADWAAWWLRRADLLHQSYGAALKTVGVVEDWVPAARESVMLWPNPAARFCGLADLENPEYRARLEQVPRYWRLGGG